VAVPPEPEPLELFTATTMPAVQPPTASAAPAAHATVFRDRLPTVLLSLLLVTSLCHVESMLIT
jgi:hypothetical protein